ncbi:MAG: hypothetical protein MI725_04820 [Pirellulales bacterium]|nr:hypothetical protein [Pirellulales bacterium]
MNQSTTQGERITAVVSTLVAIAILAAGVTAQQQHAPPSDELIQLESDLRFQLEMAFRHDTTERQKRLAQLAQVIAAWEDAPRTATNRQQLVDWLLESTSRSIPGAVEDLAAAPVFDGPNPPEPAGAPQTDFVVSSPPGPKLAKPDEKNAPTPTPVAAAPVARTQKEVLPESIMERTAKHVATDATFATIQQDTVTAGSNPSPATAEPEPRGQVFINLTELSARIAGYHEGLNALEARLVTLEEAELDILAELVDQLDGMTRNFRFVKLYHDALTAHERQAVESPRSPLATLIEIESLIERSENAEPEDFLSDLESGNLEQTEQLRQLLAAIASRVDW